MSFTYPAQEGKAEQGLRINRRQRLYKAQLSPDLRLVAFCCAPDRAATQRPPSETDAIDWRRFLAVVKRHRVEPIVYHNRARLGAALPTDVASALKAASESVVADNLRFAAESALLLRGFEDRGLQPLFVKGLTLAKLVYGSITLKKGWDIDLLVRKDELCAAASVLRAQGYSCILPTHGISDDELLRWADVSKESVWHHKSKNIYVELHTSLVDNPRLLRELDYRSRRDVEVASGIRLPTLTDDSLFSYLCVHGASSCWFRLKWLTDLAAYLSTRNPEEVTRLYEASQQMGAGRAPAQALLLCEELFESDIPVELIRSLRASWRNRALTWLALYSLDGGRPERELESQRLGTWPIHLGQLLMEDGLRFKVSEFQRQIRPLWRNRFRK